MHWNLPANPVDLEQREGRVHRYKGHAVRKNLAYKKGGEVLFQKSIDPWQELFELGRCSDTTELVPFWIYPERGEAIAYIERHVPTLPLSRDIQRLSALRKSLAVYRMVFGQNRQDDLVAYLLAYLSEEEIMDLTNQLQINLEPPVRH
jgi:hypothetical protein